MVVAASGCGGGDETADLPLAPTWDVRVITANIGNPNDAEPHYPLRLSYQAYEDYVGAQIRARAPDIVFLQEVLPPQTCEAFTESDPERTCYDAATRPLAAQRVLGDGYSVTCDARLHVECVGVKISFGTIEGVPQGGFVLAGAETPVLPLPSCVYADGACDDTACDAESTVSAVDVSTSRGALRIVHVHPNAAGNGANGFYTGEPCRYAQLEQVFEGASALAGASGDAIVAGDFNMDAESFASAAESALWDAHVGDGQRFADLGPPRDGLGHWLPTRSIFAIDHIVADGFSGLCRNHGPRAGSNENALAPFDAGFDFAVLPGGELSLDRIDHGAVECDLDYE